MLEKFKEEKWRENFLKKWWGKLKQSGEKTKKIVGKLKQKWR